jgi:uncharacterized protein YjbI with pentapeptide repeats
VLTFEGAGSADFGAATLCKKPGRLEAEGIEVEDEVAMGLEQPAPKKRPPEIDSGNVDLPVRAASNLVVPRSSLPEIADKADDLEAIKKAVDEAGSVSGALWFSYLFVLFYLAVAAGAVTHADLFLENSVKLPFLGVELPLIAFFFVAPILFLVVHAYVLMHLVMLTDKAKRFHQELRKQIGKTADLPEAEAKNIRDGLRRQLPSNVFVQFLAGAPETRAGTFGWALRAIGWTTLVFGPVLLVLMMQIQFLPYHSVFITWTHRAVLATDLVLIWWLWRRILSGREAGYRRLRAPRTWAALGFVLSLGAVVFSGAVAIFPGEWQNYWLPSLRIFRWNELGGIPVTVSFHDWVFESPVDEATRHRWFPFSSTLVLTGFNIYEGLKIDAPDKLKGRDFIFRARGRDLRGALFDLATLPNVDFEGAQLRGASFKGTQLQSSSFVDAQLQGAWLVSTQLQGASLDGARLVGANLYRAQLQGASLYFAILRGARLESAELQGARLDRAYLEGASLADAKLQGASFELAQLQGASLERAELQGSSLSRAALVATDLSHALLWRTVGVPMTIEAIRPPDGSHAWRPESRRVNDDIDPLSFDIAPSDDELTPWNDKAYQRLRKTIESIPSGRQRDKALERISKLDCADQTLGSCDPSSSGKPAVWLQDVSVDEKAYVKALASELRDLTCVGGDDEAIHILRGQGFQYRLAQIGSKATELIDDLQSESKGCRISDLLTDNDRMELDRIERQAAEAAKTPGGSGN